MKEKKKREMSGVIGRLEQICACLESLHSHAKERLKTERKAARRAKSGDAAKLGKAFEGLVAIQQILELSADKSVADTKKKKKRGAKRVAKRVREQEDEQDACNDSVDELTPTAAVGEKRIRVRGGGDSDEEGKSVAAAKSVAPRPDASACAVVGSEATIFFSAQAPREGGRWLCPAEGEEERVLVTRRELLPLRFDALEGPRKEWFMREFERELLARCEANFGHLFFNRGIDLMAARHSLCQDPAVVAVVDAVVESLVKHTQLVAVPASRIDAANNVALMLAATLHHRLEHGGAENWYADFKEQIEDICRRCKLSAKSIVRYVGVGRLMLDCRILTCLLPSFLHLHREPIMEMIRDPVILARWNAKMDSLIEKIPGIVMEL